MRVLAVDGGQSTIRVGYSDGRAWIELGGITHMEGDTASAMVRCSLALASLRVHTRRSSTSG